MVRKFLFISLATLILISCTEKKENQQLSAEIHNQYDAFLIIQKTMEDELKTFTSEKDTLIKDLKEKEGPLSTKIEMFNEKYKSTLSRFENIVDEHNEVLGDIAELEDEIGNGEANEKEIINRSKEFIDKQKEVYSKYQNILKEHDSLLKEYQSFSNPSPPPAR